MDGGGRRVGEGQEEKNKAFLMPHDGVWYLHTDAKNALAKALSSL